MSDVVGGSRGPGRAMLPPASVRGARSAIATENTPTPVTSPGQG